MLGRQFLLGGAALAALTWRVADPKGSYAVLYDISHSLTEMLAGYDVLARLISIILVDQFNGLMLGVAATAFFYMLFGGLRHVVSWPWRKRERRQVPLTRYATPRRFVRSNWARG